MTLIERFRGMRGDHKIPIVRWSLATPVTIVGIERFPAGWDLELDSGARLRLWDSEDSGPDPVPEFSE